MAYRIRELREKKKLTQEQLAQMSGVNSGIRFFLRKPLL